MEPDDLPPKVYGFKERAFKRDNARTSDAPPVPTAQELAILSGRGGPTKPKPGLSAAGSMKADDPNDVFAVLQQNRTVEITQGRDEVEIRKLKSRRKREYWLILITSEAGLAALAVNGRDNAFVLACSVAGMGLVAFGLTWIMWQVMDKY